MLNVNYPEYRRLKIAYTVTKSSPRGTGEERTHLQRVGSGKTTRDKQCVPV